MRMRPKGILLLAGVAVALAWIAWLARPEEPSYQGRALSEWIELYDKAEGGSPAEQEATRAVRQIGTNALPYLVAWIQYEPMARTNAVLKVLRQSPRPITQHLLPFLYPAQATSQSHAAVAGFRILGPEARPANPALVQLLNHTNSPYASYRAALALASIGQEGWPPLIAALGNPANRVRHVIATVLGNLDPTNATVTAGLPVLAACATNQDMVLAQAAAKALDNLSRHPRLAVPTLTNGLQFPTSARDRQLPDPVWPDVTTPGQGTTRTR